jgi:hypothetical protein
MASIVAPNLDLIEATEVSLILRLRTVVKEESIHPEESYESDLPVHIHFNSIQADGGYSK